MTAGGPGRGLIDGRFELLERLGGGGMGLVWRARDTMLQREVALKEVRSAEQAVYDDPIAAHVLRERVLREARALARLHHPNVVTIYHIVDSVEHRHPWLVMELVTGGSLDDRIKRSPLPPQEAAHIGRGVLAALRAAHAAGIQHRDVKPANVLLRPDGTPVLTDFGIAALRESTSLTATGALIGSPEYIAPERIRGQEGDPASDLWSLGMLMYVAVESHNPLRRDTSLATLAAVLDAPIPEPKHAGPLTPVLAALLTRDAAARPDAAQLDHLLAAAEQGSQSAMHGNAYGNTYGSVYGNQSHGSQSNYSSQSNYGGNSSGGSAGHGGSHGSGYSSSYSYGGPASPVDAVAYAPSGPSSDDDHRLPDHPSGPLPPGSNFGAEQLVRPRRRRTATFVASITGTAVIGMAAALIWTVRDSPASPSAGNNPGASNLTATNSPAAAAGAGSTSSAGTPTDASGTTGAAGSGQPQDLQTPAGARALVGVLHHQFGNRKIIELVIYPAYASIEVETAADPTLYDEYWYRGNTFERVSGGEVTDEASFDLDAVHWDVLPTLLRDAAAQLKVPHPTSQYLIIDGNFFGNGPGLAVYLGDDYGSAYLLADFKGNIEKSYPRGS